MSYFPNILKVATEPPVPPPGPVTATYYGAWRLPPDQPLPLKRKNLVCTFNPDSGGIIIAGGDQSLAAVEVEIAQPTITQDVTQMNRAAVIQPSELNIAPDATDYHGANPSITGIHVGLDPTETELVIWGNISVYYNVGNDAEPGQFRTSLTLSDHTQYTSFDLYDGSMTIKRPVGGPILTMDTRPPTALCSHYWWSSSGGPEPYLGVLNDRTWTWTKGIEYDWLETGNSAVPEFVQSDVFNDNAIVDIDGTDYYVHTARKATGYAWYGDQTDEATGAHDPCVAAKGYHAEGRIPQLYLWPLATVLNGQGNPIPPTAVVDLDGFLQPCAMQCGLAYDGEFIHTLEERRDTDGNAFDPPPIVHTYKLVAS